MSLYKKWIIVSRHVNPNDFYVKVDGSDFYTAFWIASSKTKEAALSLVHETICELDLGEAEITEAGLYCADHLIKNTGVAEGIQDSIEKLEDREDVQLAAWVSSEGGLW